MTWFPVTLKNYKVFPNQFNFKSIYNVFFSVFYVNREVIG